MSTSPPTRQLHRHRDLGTADAAARSHRRRDPGRRHDLGARRRTGTSTQTRTHRRAPASSAVLVYVIVLVALQLFLVTVAADAFLADDEGLAWATAAISVALFAAAAAFLRVFRS